MDGIWMFQRTFKGPTETARISTAASAASKFGRWMLHLRPGRKEFRGKVDRMKTDTVEWHAGELRHRADARPPERPCSTHSSGGGA